MTSAFRTYCRIAERVVQEQHVHPRWTRGTRGLRRIDDSIRFDVEQKSIVSEVLRDFWIYNLSYSSTMSVGDAVLPVTIEFGGGAELLFDKKKKHMVNLPNSEEWTLKRLLYWLRDNLLTERVELFLQDDTVRPGILVLVNDADWELLGQGDYKLCPNDTILFISTLHGG